MLVYSHRRSGTHLFMEYLRYSFGFDCLKYHEFPPEEMRRKHDILYIVRDGRDVLNSCYHWWKVSGESRVCGVKPSFKKLPFSKYIRGIEVPGYKPHVNANGDTNISIREIETGLFSDPIRFWKRHVVTAIYDFNLPFVRYEDLVRDPMGALMKLGSDIEVQLKRPPRRIDDLIGHHPRKGVIGDYKKLFSQEDMDYFDMLAGDLMHDLNYY